MKVGIILGLLLFAPVAFAQAPPVLVGTWNVTATPTSDSSCGGGNYGVSSANIWIISSNANGDIIVSVQGDTKFPKLRGHWRQDGKTLILEGHAVKIGGSRSSWLKLAYDPKGILYGVRRDLESTPCFADYSIIAKKP
jgi:hypothetical protein